MCLIITLHYEDLAVISVELHFVVFSRKNYSQAVQVPGEARYIRLK